MLAEARALSAECISVLKNLSAFSAECFGISVFHRALEIGSAQDFDSIFTNFDPTNFD